MSTNTSDRSWPHFRGVRSASPICAIISIQNASQENQGPEILRSPSDAATDTFTELKGEGIALGVLEEFEYETNRHEGLAEGQIIVLTTDGLWEAVNVSSPMEPDRTSVSRGSQPYIFSDLLDRASAFP